MRIETELTDIAHGGACVGRAPDGRAVFARFGLPGEKVAVEITAERSKLLRGDVVDVLESPSEHRVDHPWPAAGPLGIGGADLGHVAFAWQAEWKTHVLACTIGRIGGPELAAALEEAGIEPCVRAFDADAATSGWGTRTRIETVVDADGRLAMHREGSGDTLALDSMPLAVPELDELELFSGAWSAGVRPGTRVKAVVPSGSRPLVVIGGAAYWAPGMTGRPYVREDVVVDGALYTYRVRATGFWQVHREGAAELVRLVSAAAQVEPGDAVLELYSGAGLLTQPLALAAGKTGMVASFEGSRQAVEDARANLRDSPTALAKTAGIDERFIARAAEYPYNVIVADPPRSGLGRPAATALAASRARRIVLVSCDPAAMARDVASMVAAGRKVVALESVDMFPNTHHFETVTVLDRRFDAAGPKRGIG